MIQEVDRKKEGPLRTNSLDTGVSETLKVTPIRKVLQHVSPGRGGIGKLQNVINLHFEGNWMPIMVGNTSLPSRKCASSIRMVLDKAIASCPIFFAFRLQVSSMSSKQEFCNETAAVLDASL